MRIIVLLFISILISNSNYSQEKRLALIIGNGQYQHGGILLNPENDAEAIATELQNMDFEVIKHKNLGQNNMRRVIDNFGLRLKNYDIGLFFYAGHGVQAKGVNYLIPVDAEIWSENDAEYNCVAAGRVLAKMEDAGSMTNIVILDACRDNPFERSWTRSAKGRGLASMNAPVGSIIAYATAPGHTASDGIGENGLYTSALLNYIKNPNLRIEDVFKRVRVEVREASNGEQIPWESTSLEGDFYLVYRDIHQNFRNKQEFANGQNEIISSELKLTGNEVIENYLISVGGRETFIRIDDYIATFTILAYNNTTFHFAEYYKAPDYYTHYVRIEDDSKGNLSPYRRGKVKVSDEERDRSYIKIIIFDLIKNQYKMDFHILGYERIGDKDVIAVQVCDMRYPDTDRICYFDKNNNLALRVKFANTTIGGLTNAGLDYSDYRSVGAVMIPFQITTSINGDSQVMNIDKFIINSGVSEKKLKSYLRKL